MGDPWRPQFNLNRDTRGPRPQPWDSARHLTCLGRMGGGSQPQAWHGTWTLVPGLGLFGPLINRPSQMIC